MEEKKHTPVMVNELLNYFKPKKNSIFIDCTLGSGGHLKFLLECHKKLKVIAFDDDEEAISRCQTLFSNSNSITFINDNFVNFPYHLETLNIKKVDGFFFDLGVSSEQLSDKKRGFSYRTDSDLDMRINKKANITAKYIVNKFKCEEISDIFFNFGEERKSRVVAKAICRFRKKNKIDTTYQLVKIITSCFKKKKKKHPARRFFQALRIAVNNELDNLILTLEKTFQYLSIGGKIIVISYHSLEERIVKKIFKKKEREGNFKILTKKPLSASNEEIKINHRSRSAKMRVILKLS